ncbi:MAG: hypothetical protein A2722_04015 [Candidatus Doudnabacteria bacterium RIFCSPHIGHO2_01_FULL_50_11]|uniref:Uncharacterized protein n=1 Tax=Candidatus Doudnabacteria bacterium RIFCSPHIGHO2_01_FULL_50_11 TaxID=1817828 RepID=A0A1F5PMN4_9BACT|nr:MAG: hypothetical protein A2722_04015 [Candidatus Doudnabacteria bacterium RIFCSPHIGHO2_01_FULL_50_11]HLC44276.1 hypothetical protein [Patescibacteria group bacterium]
MKSKKITILFTFTLVIALFPFQIGAAGERHMSGEVILNSGTVYLISGNERLGFRSADEFLADGYTFDMVVPATDADMALPYTRDVSIRDGSLVLDLADNQTIYLIYAGIARPVAIPAFAGTLGTEQRIVYQADLSLYARGAEISFDFFYAARPKGSLIDNSGTVYLAKDSGLAPFPSEAIFRSHGYNFDMVLQVNPAEMKRPVVEAMRYRDGSIIDDAGTVYLIAGVEKWGFKTWEGYLSRGYSPKAILQGTTQGYILAGTYE